MDPLGKALGEMRVAWGEVYSRMKVYNEAVEKYNNSRFGGALTKKLYDSAMKAKGEVPGAVKEALDKIAAARKAFSDFRTQHWGLEEKVRGYKEMCKAIQDEMDRDENYMTKEVPAQLKAGDKLFK